MECEGKFIFYQNGIWFVKCSILTDVSAIVVEATVVSGITVEVYSLYKNGIAKIS